MRKIDECGMDMFGTLDTSEKTIAILGDSGWPQKAKQEAWSFYVKRGKKHYEHPNVRGVYYE